MAKVAVLVGDLRAAVGAELILLIEFVVLSAAMIFFLIPLGLDLGLLPSDLALACGWCWSWGLGRGPCCCWLSATSMEAPLVWLARTAVSKYSTQASQRTTKEETRKDVSTVEETFDPLTYIIPEKPVTFVEGASYSFVILAGLGVAAFAAYAVFKELVIQPKEYKVFNKALQRIQDDSQVKVRIGSPITGYGSESRNRHARQRIPHSVWKDQKGVEHIKVNFYIRGPHGAGMVDAVMFKDPKKSWQFQYLMVNISSPSRTQLMLEPYIPDNSPRLRTN